MGLRNAIARRFGGAGGQDGERVPEPEATAEGGAAPMVELAGRVVEEPRTVSLRDGRQLGYAEVGDPDGEPLVFHHGFPNSRVLAAWVDEVATDHGVRVIAPERPGFGVSDPAPDRALTDWPADVADLADALDIDSFSVFGISGGSPYTAVTAALLGEHVERAGITSGLAPMASVGLRDRLWYYTARYLPPVSKLAIRGIVRSARSDREEFLEGLADRAAPADEALWTGPIGRVIHASALEAARHHGLDPLVTETAIYGSPWGFDLGSIDVPLGLWYGKADVIVPPEMGLYLAEHVPTAESHVYPDLDHLSTFEHNDEEIFGWLTG